MPNQPYQRREYLVGYLNQKREIFIYKLVNNARRFLPFPPIFKSIKYVKQSSNQIIERGDFRNQKRGENFHPTDKHERPKNRRLSTTFGESMPIRDEGRNRRTYKLFILNYGKYNPIQYYIG